MKQLAYANLFIDNDWDEERILDSIFKVRIQSTQKILESYLTFGHFLVDDTDYVLMESKSDPELLNYWSKWFKPAGEITEDEISQIDFSDIKLVGVSKREEKLSKKVSINLASTAEEFIKFNSKDFLVKIAERHGFNFPETKIINLEELSGVTPPAVIKFLTSSGGRGVLIIDEKRKGIPFYFYEQLKEIKPDIKMLKQRHVEIAENFYTLSDTESGKAFGFSIDYDASNSSRKHRLEKEIDPERIKVAKILADELKNLGYHGSFGFDGVKTTSGIMLPAIDLNVRIDKARLILMAIEKFKIEQEFLEFRRERFYRSQFLNFSEFEKIVLNPMQNEFFEIVPVICSNMFGSGLNKQQMELSFFVLKKTNYTDEERLKEWDGRLIKLLEGGL